MQENEECGPLGSSSRVSAIDKAIPGVITCILRIRISHRIPINADFDVLR